nr:tetratricopeptide repeat protein [Nonomuraea guangzhouensis]
MTSLVSAGVLPRLDSSRFDVLSVGGLARPPFVPAAVIPEDSDPHVFALLASWSPYENPMRFVGLTVRSYLRWHHWSPGGRPIMAVLDHAEEVFTAYRRKTDDQSHVLDQLCDALDYDLRLRLLIVVDDEHLESLRGHDRLRDHIERGASYKLEPLSFEAALEACQRPVDLVGRELAPWAAGQLVNALRITDTGRDGSPSLTPMVEPVHLQVVCSALWESVRDQSGPMAGTLVSTDDIDEVLASFCHRAILDVARDHLQGDVDRLAALLRRVVDDGGMDAEELPHQVAQALAERHVLQLGDKRRYEMPDRLVRPFLRGPTKRTPPDEADRLDTAAAALHRGWFEVAEKLAGQEILQPEGVRSKARAESLLGDAAYLRDDFDGAITHYREATRIFATMGGSDQIVAALLTAVGRILIDQGAYRDAVTELRSAVRRSPEPAIQTELAWALWYLGHESGAVDVLDGALRFDGNTHEALRARGEILSDLEPQRALRDLDRVRPHEQPSTQAAYALALALSGDVRGAVEAVPTLDVDSDATTLLRTARVMEVAGRDSEAARLAGRARESTSRPLPPQMIKVAERLAD